MGRWIGGQERMTPEEARAWNATGRNPNPEAKPHYRPCAQCGRLVQIGHGFATYAMDRQHGKVVTLHNECLDEYMEKTGPCLFYAHPSNEEG